MKLSTGTCAGQHYECCAEDSVEDISFLVETNLLVWLIISPAVDTVQDVLLVTALNIDGVSPFTLHAAKHVGEARLGFSDVVQEILHLHPPH